ncbi:type VII toxin-antitoxin system HepT family RNase toxin [Cytobacillus praedii]|uniref:type VII toxin-antitoxin system HepT family RNase toxin n=1 Tax=Cytobacillus praedii TaxID=1742358 RepID=UPI00070D7DD8|nr:DUF86 domain-containing protein [Cytobacillus praedii]MED3549552.1 DUF86 domain-containing protein [Cytobacillus praedii]MED3573794.1 DUF86 domain-containing protein [Cytobacillus praedii]
MYFVDREKIETTLVFLEQQFFLFEQIKNWDSPIEKAAMERVSHLMIEAILDVGNSMIDGFIMRDPGSYEDIVDILDDEKVIHKELSSSCKEIIKYRKMLVQDYTEINHSEVAEVFAKHLPVIKQFPASVRAYLLNELGPVSAFRN